MTIETKIATNNSTVDTANNTGNITGNSDNELTDREKFLAAKEEIKTTAGRYLGDGKFAQIWQRNNGFGWRNIAKKNAALILAEYGLTVDEYLAAQKQWVAEEVARGAAECAIYYQAQFLRDKIRRDCKPVDDDSEVFDLLPSVDELNDVDLTKSAYFDGRADLGYIFKLSVAINHSFDGTRPWTLESIDGNITVEGRTWQDYAKFIITDTDGSEEDNFADEMPALFPAEDSDDDDELIDPTVEELTTPDPEDNNNGNNGNNGNNNNNNGNDDARANEEIINCNEIKAATTDVTNAPEVTRFQKGKTYRYYDANTDEFIWYIAIEKRTNTTVTTVSGEKFKVFIQPHDRMLNYNKPTESFICGKYRIDATDACEETADEITPSTLQKFIEAKKEVAYWRNSTGARIWQIAYIRYGVNDGIVGQTPWLNRTMKEADRYLKDEYSMTLLEYLAAEDKWNDTDKGAILKDKIERDSKPSVESIPAYIPTEDSDDDDELIDPPVDNNTVTDTTPEYKYYIKSRRPIFGAAPNGYIKAVSGEVHEPVRRTNGTYSPKCRIYFATVIYDKPLTDEQILNYDLAVSNETFELLNAPLAQNEMSTISNIAETDGSEEDDDDELIDEPELPPAVDFEAKLAELKAKQDAAKEKELAAEKVYKEASDKYVECQEATQDFLDAHADKLTEKISAIEIESYITMVRDNGKERYDVFSTNQLNVDAFNGFGEMFIVRYQGNVLGTYDTPAQIEVVINQLKAAVERGDREFKFPTVDELNKPEIDKDATADSLTRAMKIALEKYQDFCRVGNLTAATNEWSLYNICRKAISELLKEEVA